MSALNWFTGKCLAWFRTISLTFVLVASSGSAQPVVKSDAAGDATMQRIRTQTPAPGGEDAIRHYVTRIQSGYPDYAALEGQAAEDLRSQGWRRNAVASAGPLKRIKFLGVEAGGGLDVYLVETDKYLSEWSIDMSPSGKLDIAQWRLLEKPPTIAPSESQFVADVKARARETAAKDEWAGAILIERAGHRLYSAAFGMADRERGVRNTLNTRFRFGSMGKMFTAVAVLQLVEHGKIDLDANLSTYLPDYPNHDLATKVTVRELLSHTGATGDIFGPEFDVHRTELRTLKDYVALYGKRGLWHERLGDRYAYSNYGFILLGRIIEAVSDESYYDYVRTHVFLRAGMTSTGLQPEQVKVERRAIPYTRGEAQTGWHSAADTLPYRGTSAGGGYSTVGDLLRFADALQSHRLLSARYTRLLTTGKVFIGEGSYAYGMVEAQQNGVHWIGHSGGAPGMCGELRIAPERRFVIITLANTDPPSCIGLSEYAAANLPR